MTNSFDLGGGGNAFPFDHVGASVTGKIMSMSEVQQTDMDTGQPAFWDGGQPKMMFHVELSTDLRDDAGDDGTRSVYLRGSRKPETKSSLAAVLAAVKAATGATKVAPGATLTLTYSGDGEPSRRGFNAPKQYEARYVAPSTDLDAAAAPPAGGQPQAAPAAAPAGPAYSAEQIAAAKAAGIPLPGID